MRSNPFVSDIASQQSGFTLLELMVSITVLGVLLAIGVPAFNEIIRNNRTSAQANELVTALNLARSEASKLGLPMTVCAANADQTACAGPTVNDWANGWLVFSDRINTAGDTAGVVDATDRILQTSHAVGAQLQLTSGNVGFVRFGARGTPTTAVTFSLRHASCTGQNRRRISLIATGRVNTAKVSCT